MMIPPNDLAPSTSSASSSSNPLDFSALESVIEDLHQTPHMLVYEFAGAGVQALAWLHAVAGSSATILEANDRYSKKSFIESAGFEPEHSEVTMKPSTEVALDVEQAQKLLKLIDVLEDIDDVQDVYTNAEIPPEAYA